MARRWKTLSEEQSLELEQRAAHYRRTGARIMKTSLEPWLVQSQADAALVRDMASFDAVREYASDSAAGVIRACVICNATSRARPVDHEANCLWLRAVKAMKDRVRTPIDLPDTELLNGPGSM
jgi:hypothetical protein